MRSVLIGVFDNTSQAREAHARIVATDVDPAAMTLSGGGATAAQRAMGPRAAPAKLGMLDRFFGDLFGHRDDAPTHRKTVPRGHCVLTVAVADDNRADRVSTLMENCGAIDVERCPEPRRATPHSAP